MATQLVIRSSRVELPQGQEACDIVVDDGRILDVLPYGSFRGNCPIEDFGRHVILPGLIDPHVHLNEPGRSDWEGFDTGTRAARAGGITTLVDMPLNSNPVTVDLPSLAAKRASAVQLYVDVGFHAGVVPQAVESVGELIDAGAIAAKAFLCHSGIDDFPASGEVELRAAMSQLASRKKVLMAHAEIVHDVAPMRDPTCYLDYLESRPPSFERTAIELLIRLAEDTGCRVHIVHLADSDCLEMLVDAMARGVGVTVETCPHYLWFKAESIPDGATPFKCAPPIRHARHRERLWQGLMEGHIDMIASDHSPCPPDLKDLEQGRFDQAWGGISSLQLGLPIVWTQARKRGATLSDVVRWMSINPGKIFNLPAGIVVGHPAHLVVFDPDAEWIVDQAKLLHRHRITPYHGERLSGEVIKTFVHGQSDLQPHGRRR